MDLLDEAYLMAREELLGLPQRLRHVEGVARRIEAAINLLPNDRQVLKASAFLHDIGYSPNIVESGLHALDGARFLARRGWPRRVCALVAHHSCAYIEASLRGLSAQMSEWADEGTAIRDALWWADMTTSPDGEPMPFEARIAEIQERYGPQDVVTFFIRQATPELQAAVERTEERLQNAGISYA